MALTLRLHVYQLLISIINNLNQELVIFSLPLTLYLTFYCNLEQVIVIQFLKVIQDKRLVAYNKGQPFINGQNPKAFEVCGEAFKENLQKFFVHRTIEMASSGILVLIFCGSWTYLPTTKINNESPPHTC
jgi:hypothetical protein